MWFSRTQYTEAAGLASWRKFYRLASETGRLSPCLIYTAKVAALPVVHPAPLWTNQNLTLYHGTVDPFAMAIVTGPVLTSRGRTHTDFGPGFYTTTILRQAQMWAAQLAAMKENVAAAVVQLIVPREDLAELDALAFVRGDFHADDFWSLVHHCRQGATDHGRTPIAPHYSRLYDIVYGPVAAFWNQRMAIVDADQVSFHTPRAEAVLNRSTRMRII